jgi:hypothetical protein
MHFPIATKTLVHYAAGRPGILPPDIASVLFGFTNTVRIPSKADTVPIRRPVFRSIADTIPMIGDSAPRRRQQVGHGGEYMLIPSQHNIAVLGFRYDATFEDIGCGCGLTCLPVKRLAGVSVPARSPHPLVLELGAGPQQPQRPGSASSASRNLPSSVPRPWFRDPRRSRVACRSAPRAPPI